MIKYEVLKNYISGEVKNHYEKLNKGWNVTGDCLAIETRGTLVTYVIFTGPFTKENMVRDCGKYYELYTGNRIPKV